MAQKFMSCAERMVCVVGGLAVGVGKRKGGEGEEAYGIAISKHSEVVPLHVEESEDDVFPTVVQD